jgi:hypothetical protein
VARRLALIARDNKKVANHVPRRAGGGLSKTAGAPVTRGSVEIR